MSCPRHDAAHVCEKCPERYDTDARGFVHPQLRKGRVPLRVCNGCGLLTPPEWWSKRDWFRCAACAPGKAPE